MLGLVRSAALDLGRRGIRVNAVGPGPIATEALLARMATSERERGDPGRAGARERPPRRPPSAGSRPSTRSPTPRSSSRAGSRRGITGQLLPVDGGCCDAISTGKTVVVTGASRGIGAAAAAAIGAGGATVVAHYGAVPRGRRGGRRRRSRTSARASSRPTSPCPARRARSGAQVLERRAARRRGRRQRGDLARDAVRRPRRGVGRGLGRRCCA